MNGIPLITPASERLLHAVRSLAARPAPPVGCLVLPAARPVPPVRRLVVLVSDRAVPAAVPAALPADELARATCELAAPRALPVLFVGRARQPEEVARLRQHLATLEALARGAQVAASVYVAREAGWLRAVRRLARTGDLVVCLADESVPAGPLGLWRRPLARVVPAELGVPAYTLPLAAGRRPAALPLERWLSALVGLALIVGSFWVQVLVIREAAPAWRTVLLSAVVMAEFGLFGLFARYFGSG